MEIKKCLSLDFMGSLWSIIVLTKFWLGASVTSDILVTILNSKTNFNYISIDIKPFVILMLHEIILKEKNC